MIKQFVAKRMMGSLLHLQPWDIEYMRHLIAEWNTLNVDPNHVDAIRITELVTDFSDHEKRGRVHRGHLLEFEQTLLNHQTADSLTQQAPVIRLRYRDIVGERQYACYKELQLPDCKPLDEPTKRMLADDLSALVGSIHWRYVLGPFRDKERTALTISALIWVAIYTAIWSLLLFTSATFHHSPFLAVFTTVLYAGILGGFISALRRMQSINDDTDSVFVIQGIAGADFWLWFSPLLGAVFAVVAYLFFLSGLVGGMIFPEFRAPLAPAVHLATEPWWFWTDLVPRTQQDYAKLFLWCFISGFAERFIPDMIDRIIQRAQGAQSNAPMPAQPVIVLSNRSPIPTPTPTPAPTPTPTPTPTINR